MCEPRIQVQQDKPPMLVNSAWVEWASDRINELELAIAEHKQDALKLWAVLGGN